MLTQPLQTSFSFTASRKSAARWTYPLEALAGRPLPLAQAHSLITWLRNNLQQLETLDFISLLWNEDLWERCGCSILELLNNSTPAVVPHGLNPSKDGLAAVTSPGQNLRSLTLSFHLEDDQLLILAAGPCCANLTKLALSSSRKKGRNTLPEVGPGLCCLLAATTRLQDLHLSSFQLPRDAPCHDLVFPQGLTKLAFTSSRFCASVELIILTSLSTLGRLQELDLSDSRGEWWHQRMWLTAIYRSCRMLTQLTRITLWGGVGGGVGG